MKCIVAVLVGIACAGAMSCAKDQAPTSTTTDTTSVPVASIFDLQVSNVQVIIGRDLMPIVLPPGVPNTADRISCRVTMDLQNQSTVGVLDSLTVVSSLLTSADEGLELARFRFTADSVTLLRPGMKVTRTYYRVQQAADTVLAEQGTAVCNRQVVLSLFISAIGTKTRQITAAPVTFGCTF